MGKIDKRKLIQAVFEVLQEKVDDDYKLRGNTYIAPSNDEYKDFISDIQIKIALDFKTESDKKKSDIYESFIDRYDEIEANKNTALKSKS